MCLRGQLHLRALPRCEAPLMWLMTKYGFFSVVEKTDGVHIRARERADLENLLGVLPLEILSTPANDYPFRMVTDHVGLTLVLGHVAKTLDYPNFKGVVAITPGQSQKLQAYHDVWATLARSTASWAERRRR